MEVRWGAVWVEYTCTRSHLVTEETQEAGDYEALETRKASPPIGRALTSSG